MCTEQTSTRPTRFRDQVIWASTATARGTPKRCRRHRNRFRVSRWRIEDRVSVCFSSAACGVSEGWARSGLRSWATGFGVGFPCSRKQPSGSARAASSASFGAAHPHNNTPVEERVRQGRPGGDNDQAGRNADISAERCRLLAIAATSRRKRQSRVPGPKGPRVRRAPGCRGNPGHG